jgi:hypothetical protein
MVPTKPTEKPKIIRAGKKIKKTKHTKIFKEHRVGGWET